MHGLDRTGAGDAELQVSLIVLDETSYRPELGDELAREVIGLRRDAPDVLWQSDGPQAPVAVVWLSPEMSEETLMLAVAWRDRAPRHVGLVGCVPDGTYHHTERALTLGFDDFVTGRIYVRELAGRLRALARRVMARPTSRRPRLRHGRITVDPTQRQLWLGDRSVELTRTELAVMAALISARGRPRSRAEIMAAARDLHGLKVGERTFDSVMSRLRRKLGEPGLIETIRGVGFVLAD